MRAVPEREEEAKEGEGGKPINKGKGKRT